MKRLTIAAILAACPLASRAIAPIWRKRIDFHQ